MDGAHLASCTRCAKRVDQTIVDVGVLLSQEHLLDHASAHYIVVTSTDNERKAERDASDQYQGIQSKACDIESRYHAPVVDLCPLMILPCETWGAPQSETAYADIVKTSEE
jgi:hypothetical protein